MMRNSARAGMTLIELLIGMMLGLVGTAALTALLRAGVSAGERAGVDAEAAIETAAAVDQLVRDVRVAGYDPAGAGIAAFAVVAADRIEIQADLDGNGTIDAGSDEHIGYRVATSSRSLQRVVGAQSLPILSDVGAGGLRLAYFDAAGTRLDPTEAATGAATRLVEVDLTSAPSGRPAAVHVHGGARLVNR
jgi:type II secretory pathway component PulJ